jgi:MFS family permease
VPLKIQLSVVLFGYGLVRIAGAASGVLVGLYVAELANPRAHMGAALVGLLGAVAYAAELLSALPLGIAADHLSRRVLISGGALLGAAATQLFGLTGQIFIFFLSRSLEGIAAAAIAPALLAHLTDVTAGDRALRARVLSYFELSLLGGLGVGGLLAGLLWERLRSGAFSMVAAVYLAAMVCLAVGAAGTRCRRVELGQEWGAVLRDATLRKFAPLLLCVSAIAGLWLGPTLPFLLIHASTAHQYLVGLYAHEPGNVGWLLLGYSLVFATGLLGWSHFLPRLSAPRAMRISLLAMLAVCGGLGLLNASSHYSTGARWLIGIATAALIMVESGFAPAALVWLTGSLGARIGRGAAMGAYSVLLGLGAVLGSLLAAALAPRFAVDGLIFATIAMAALGLLLLRGLTPGRARLTRTSRVDTAL